MIFDLVFVIVRMAAIVAGIGLLSYAIGYWFVFIWLHNTFTIYEINCKKCGKKFSSRISIMSDLKYRFHKFLGPH